MLRIPSLGNARTTVFGVLRDRSPERSAEAFLRSIRGGQCHALIASDPRIRLVNTDCSKELANPLSSWKLTDRLDEGDGKSHLVYVWGNALVPVSHGNLIEMDLRKQEGTWKVVVYDRVF